MDEFSLLGLFNKTSQKLSIDFEESSRLVQHLGEKGKGQENVLKRILQRYIPQRFGIDSGFIYDWTGKRSKQLDVIIFDKTHSPVFEVLDGVRYYPCETVVAAGEVKSKITSKEDMREALAKIKSAKLLDRSNGGKSQLICGPGIFIPNLPSFDPKRNYRDQIFGFIFSSGSINMESVLEELRPYCSQNDRTLWPNLIVDYNHHLIGYECESGLTRDPHEAKHFYCTRGAQTSNLFALFFAILCTYLNEARVARPDLLRHIGMLITEHTDYPI